MTSRIKGLAGVAAAGLVAEHVREDEIVEEPVRETPLPAELHPEEPISETVQVEPGSDFEKTLAEEGPVEETELAGEAVVPGEEELELPEWLRGFDEEESLLL
jgi:hypothetical protein